MSEISQLPCLRETYSEGLDLDSSFAVDILGKAGLMEFVNTPKRKYPAFQPSTNEHKFASSIDFKKMVQLFMTVHLYHLYILYLIIKVQESEAESLLTTKNECNTEGLSASKYSRQEETSSHNETEPRLFHSISFYRKQQQVRQYLKDFPIVMVTYFTLRI